MAEERQRIAQERDAVIRRITEIDKAKVAEQPKVDDTTIDPPKPANTDDGRDREAERLAERQREFVESLKESNEQRAFELTLIGKVEREAQILAEIEKERTKAADLGLTLTGEQEAAIRASVGALYDGQKALEASQKIDAARLQLATARNQIESREVYIARMLATELKGATGEQRDAYKVETFAKIFSLSRKVVINDQFGVFGDMMRKLGQLAAAAEGTALVNLLLQGGGAGPVMSDGKRLFHADHGNVTTATWPADAWWDFMKAAIEKLRLQTGIDGETPLNIAPKYLVVPPALEGAARDMWASFYDTTVARQGKVPWHDSLELIIEPRLAADKWLVFGDQATSPVLEMAYLASAPGPQIQSRDGWDTLGREYRVTLDLGVGVTDHRGVVQTTVVPKAS